MKTGVLLLLLMLTLRYPMYGQDFIDLGVTAGTGAIGSDSPFLSGFTSSVSIGAGKSYNTVTPRISFYYSGDFNSILPSSDRDYYPFIKAVALKGIYAVNVSGDLYYEQGLGIFIANDRIFRSINEWGAGFIITILGGADLRGVSYSGFRVGIGGEYGLTVYNRYIRYAALFLQAQYIFSFNL